MGRVESAYTQWRGDLGKGFGLTSTCSPDADFASALTACPVGRLHTAQVRMHPQTLRPARAAARDALFIKLVVEGGIVLDSGHGQQHRLLPGGMAIVNPASTFLEHIIAPTRMLVINVPLDLLHEREAPPCEAGLLLPETDPDSLIVRDLLTSLVTHAPQAGAVRLADCLLDFFIPMITQAHRRTAQQQRARLQRVIDENLATPSMDAAAIAASAGMSLVEANAVLAAEGVTLMGLLWSCRLHRARAWLRSRHFAHLNIEALAWRCGFVSAAHFSRQFKATFGLTPREMRQNSASTGPVKNSSAPGQENPSSAA